jgi:hypothetical protein
MGQTVNLYLFAQVFLRKVRYIDFTVSTNDQPETF